MQKIQTLASPAGETELSVDGIVLSCVKPDCLYSAVNNVCTLLSCGEGNQSLLFPESPVLPAGCANARDTWLDYSRHTGKLHWFLCSDDLGNIYSDSGPLFIALALALDAGDTTAVTQIISTCRTGCAGDRIVAGFLPDCRVDDITNISSIIDNLYDLCRQQMITAEPNLRNAPPGVFCELRDLLDAGDGKLDPEAFRQYIMEKYREGKLLIGIIPMSTGDVVGVAILPDTTNVVIAGPEIAPE